MKKKIIAAFLCGFFVIGTLDLFHVVTGVEIYHSDLCKIFDFNWPCFIPLQMGVASVVILISWMWLSNNWKWLKCEKSKDSIKVMALSMVIVISVYVASSFLIYNPFRVSIYIFLYVISIGFTAFMFSKKDLSAFILMGIVGVSFESTLSQPCFGYYEFIEKDIFQRTPFWLPTVYGWVGIFINRISESD